MLGCEIRIYDVEQNEGREAMEVANPCDLAIFWVNICDIYYIYLRIVLLAELVCMETGKRENYIRNMRIFQPCFLECIFYKLIKI